MANISGAGGFKKGHPNVGGRKLGSKNKFSKDSFKAILNALSIVEKDVKISGGKNFWIHCAERAYKSDMVAIALLKKLCPDLQAIEYDLAKGGRVKKVRFEIIEGNNDKPDLSTKKTLKELEE